MGAIRIHNVVKRYGSGPKANQPVNQQAPKPSASNSLPLPKPKRSA